MAGRQIGLADVAQGARASRLRLLAPLRYLQIRNPEKTKYDFVIPLAAAAVGWGLYLFVEPKPPIFGEAGLLKFLRDVLIMAVPFMIGALAAVAMGSPGQHIDRRPAGVDLVLEGEILTLRQFVCYLLGYLSFIAVLTLAAVIAATLLQNTVLSWAGHSVRLVWWVKMLGALALSTMISFLSVTILWSLYFLTDIVNRKSDL